MDGGDLFAKEPYLLLAAAWRRTPFAATPKFTLGPPPVPTLTSSSGAGCVKSPRYEIRLKIPVQMALSRLSQRVDHHKSRQISRQSAFCNLLRTFHTPWVVIGGVPPTTDDESPAPPSAPRHAHDEEDDIFTPAIHAHFRTGAGTERPALQNQVILCITINCPDGERSRPHFALRGVRARLVEVAHPIQAGMERGGDVSALGDRA